MFGHGEISTETDKKPFIFTVTAFLGSLAGTVLLFALGKGDGLAVFAGILLVIVAAAAGAVLLAIVTDRAYIEDGILYMSYLFKRKSIPLGEIGRIEYKENVYSVYDRKGSVAGTINGQLTGIDVILYHLDKNGVRFV